MYNGFIHQRQKNIEILVKENSARECYFQQIFNSIFLEYHK